MGPLFNSAVRNRWLRHVIDDQKKFATGCRHCPGVLQMACVHQKMVRGSVRAEPLQASQDLGLREPIVPRLTFHQMPHSFELRMRGQFRQLLFRCRTRQIYPADDSGNEWVSVGQIQQPTRLRYTITRLDQDSFRNTVALEYWLQCWRQVVAIEHFNIAGHPGIVEATNLPEVLMGIDNHLGASTSVRAVSQSAWPRYSDAARRRIRAQTWSQVPGPASASQSNAHDSRPAQILAVHYFRAFWLRQPC